LRKLTICSLSQFYAILLRILVESLDWVQCQRVEEQVFDRFGFRQKTRERKSCRERYLGKHVTRNVKFLVEASCGRGGRVRSCHIKVFGFTIPRRVSIRIRLNKVWLYNHNYTMRDKRKSNLLNFSTFFIMLKKYPACPDYKTDRLCTIFKLSLVGLSLNWIYVKFDCKFFFWK